MKKEKKLKENDPGADKTGNVPKCQEDNRG